MSDFNVRIVAKFFLTFQCQEDSWERVKILCTYNIVSQGVPVGDNPVTEIEFPDVGAAKLHEHFVGTICCFVKVRQV